MSHQEPATEDGARWVGDPDSLAELCATLREVPRYAFDTEFHRERTYHPHLALVQLAWEDPHTGAGQVALVDPLAVDVRPLAPLLESDVLAVAHAVDQDLEVLAATTGAVPSRVFDTQLAAGFLGMATPSLGRLVEDLVGITLPKADRLSDWIQRPLTADQRLYAAADVAHLLAAGDALSERLERRGRLEWAIEECAYLVSRRRLGTVPEEAWWKMRDSRALRGRSRGVAQEVAAWRERVASATDVPTRFVLPDMAMSAIAHRPPRSMAELERVRGLERRHLVKGRGEELMRAVEAGAALGPESLREPPDAAIDRTRRPAVALAAAWVGQLADDLRIDAGLLATRSDLADLLEGRPSRLDHGWRRQLAGQPVLDLASGRAALAFDGKGGLVIEARSHQAVVSDAGPGEAGATG